MFCEKCGKEIMDEAVICPNCGCSTRKNNIQNNNAVQTSEEHNVISSISSLTLPARVCAFLFPLIGMIIAGVGLSKISSAKMLQLSAKGKYTLDQNKTNFTTSIIIATVMMFFSIIIITFSLLIAFG